MINDTRRKLIDGHIHGTAGREAILVGWPDNFSEKAKTVIRYLDDTAFLFLYKGKYVVTDESLWLMEDGDGSSMRPYGSPRFESDTIKEVEGWLESVYNDLRADWLI